MEKDKIEQLIVKLFSGEISPEEQSQLEEWYASSGQNISFTEHLSWEGKDELEKKLLSRIDFNIRINEERATRYQASKNVHRSSGFQRIKIAAAVTVVLLFAALTYYSMRPQSIHYATSYGEIIEVILPDSSHVIMNGNSTLTTAKNWLSDQSREVHLEGEAIFSVRKNKNNQKFIVHTSDEFNVEVLGTEFNVFNRDSKTRVVLNSGAVQLNINKNNVSDQIQLVPGDLLEYSGDPFQYAKRQVNVRQYNSWKDGRLLLDNTSLSEIIIMLKETYGLNIIVDDEKLMDEKVSGSLSIKDVNRLIEDLAVTLDLNTKIGKDTIYFTR